MPLSAASLRFADGSQPQYLLPVVVLLEYLEQLVLLEELAQLRRVVHRRYAQQQQPVKILLQPEQVQVGRVCEHRAVVIVVIPVNLVVRGVQAPRCFRAA